MNQAVSRILRVLSPFIALALGVVVIVVCAIQLGHHKTYLSAKATIESIEVDYGVGEDDSDTYTVMVAYTVDGTTYHSELGEMKSGYHEGKEVDILYNPENPEKIIPAGKTGFIIGIVVGGVACLAGVGMFIGNLRRRGV